jgi:hypothetical protein
MYELQSSIKYRQFVATRVKALASSKPVAFFFTVYVLAPGAWIKDDLITTWRDPVPICPYFTVTTRGIYKSSACCAKYWRRSKRTRNAPANPVEHE